MLGGLQSSAFLGGAKRGGVAMQIGGVQKPGFEVMLLDMDDFFIDALADEPGSEALIAYLQDGRHTCGWDGMILIMTPSRKVAISCITGHTSAACIAAGGNTRVGVGIDVAVAVLGVTAMITRFSPRPLGR